MWEQAEVGLRDAGEEMQRVHDEAMQLVEAQKRDTCLAEHALYLSSETLQKRCTQIRGVKKPINTGREKPINTKNFSGLSREWVGNKLVYVSRDNPGTIPWNVCLCVFSCSMFFRLTIRDGPSTTTTIIFKESFASDATSKRHVMTHQMKNLCVSLCSTASNGHLVRHPGVLRKWKMGPREMNSKMVVVVVGPSLRKGRRWLQLWSRLVLRSCWLHTGVPMPSRPGTPKKSVYIYIYIYSASTKHYRPTKDIWTINLVIRYWRITENWPFWKHSAPNFPTCA